MLYILQGFNSTMSWPVITIISLFSCHLLPAQDPQPPAQEPTAAAIGDWPQKLEWPRDKDRVICIVAGEPYTLTQMLTHIQTRHRPGLISFLATPAGKPTFTHPSMSVWVRQYADILCLEKEADRRGSSMADAREFLAAELKHGFEDWLAGYAAERERSGHPLELTQARVNKLLTDFQSRSGLRTELDGWLNFLVEGTDLSEREELLDFYASYANIFGGAVTISHILIQHRDPRTLELLTGEARQKAMERLASVRARLEEDGSNFEEVAILMSEDRRTSRNGGLLEGIKRFDPRLPAAICRSAWTIPDNSFVGPVETPYGLEFIKRKFFKNEFYVMNPNDEFLATIAATKRRLGQESLVFDLREKYSRRLLY